MRPEDLSRVYVSADGKKYLEARYADLRRPAISLWEQRAAVRALRSQGQPKMSEPLIFKAIEQQRQIVARARWETERVRAKSGSKRSTRQTPRPGNSPPPSPSASTEVDYAKPVEAFPVEIW
jgi:putative transposase